MAQLLKRLNPEISKYRDRRFDGNQEQFDECLCSSTTLYIGNLSFFTTEEQIWEVFSKVGDVKRIVMGLDKHRRTPCGFCFVVYYTRADAEAAVRYVNGSVLDDRPIRVDFDWGFQEGRQYGRGRSGGQVRDEYRLDYDEGRGGYGKVVLRELSARQAAVQRQMYAEGQDGFGEGATPGSSYRASKRRRTGGPLEEEEGEGGGDASGGGPCVEEQQRGARYRDRDSDEED